jgi:hypothetical protein
MLAGLTISRRPHHLAQMNRRSRHNFRILAVVNDFTRECLATDAMR